MNLKQGKVKHLGFKCLKGYSQSYILQFVEKGSRNQTFQKKLRIKDLSYDFFTYKIELGTATPVVYQQSQGPLYAELLTTNKLSDYHTDLNKQAETMFSRTVYPLNRKVAVTDGGFSFSGSIQEVIQFRE